MNFLEQHALESLTRDADLTLDMYAVLNDLDAEQTERLRMFLAGKLPPRQVKNPRATKEGA